MAHRFFVLRATLRRVLGCFLLLAGATHADAEPKWIHVISSDFEIFSSAGESGTIQVLQHFEEVRSFFNRNSGGNQGGNNGGNQAKPAEPVRIIVFGTEKEYLPYRLSEAAAAFYTQVAGRDYIVLGNVSDNVFPAAVHEYVHLVAQHSGMILPPWLSEGLADVYSTLKPEGRQIVVGNVVAGHIYEMRQNKWVPLETILAVDHNSPYYNEKNKAGAFYAESWALTHMLMLDPAYAPGFTGLVAALRAGGSSQQTIENYYGKPLARFDKDLQNYILASSLSGRLVPAKLDAGQAPRPEPAPAFDVRLALLDLLEKPGKEAERRKGLADLAADYPQRPEPHSALGYLAWRTSQKEEALKEFKTALDLGGNNRQMLWDYGRMAASSDSSDAMRALKLLSSLDPGRVDVILVIAQLQLNANQYKDVLATLTSVKKVTPADAPALFRSMAIAQMNDGDPDEAARSAQRWKDTAKEDGDLENATRFIAYLDSSREAKQAALQPRPSLRENTSAPDRRSSNESVADNAQPGLSTVRAPVLALRTNRPFVTGTFVEFNCSGKKPRFVLKTQQGNVSFLMDDPKGVFIRGRDNDTIDLYCGAQKEALAVRIEYDPPPSSENSVRGIARIVQFEAVKPDSPR
jgi:tetratricopeptide (TPR) repeat protein